jgi:hypothetical protein
MSGNKTEQPAVRMASPWIMPVCVWVAAGGVLAGFLANSHGREWARSMLGTLPPTTFYPLAVAGMGLVLLAVLRPRIALWLVAVLLPVSLAISAAHNLRVLNNINQSNLSRIERRTDPTLYGLMLSCKDRNIAEIHAFYQYLRMHLRGRPVALCCRDKVNIVYLDVVSRAKLLPHRGPHDLKEEEFQRIKDKTMVEFRDGEGNRFLVPKALETGCEGETIYMRRHGKDHYFLPASWLDLEGISTP